MEGRYMFIKKNGKAIHKLGDISRGYFDAELIFVNDEDEDNWIGQFCEGFGFMEVKFAKSDCRLASEAEIALCEKGFAEEIKFEIEAPLPKVIDYTKIDEKCIPMVEYFNSIGLVTQFSCQGHNDYRNAKFYIMFDRKVSDEMIFAFLEKHSNEYNHTPFVGCFVKWARKLSGKIVCNWMYEVNIGYCQLNQDCAESDLKKMKETFK